MSEQRPKHSETARQFASLHRSALIPGGAEALPVLLTVDDVAQLLRTANRAIYAMTERQQLPGIVRIGRPVMAICQRAYQVLRLKNQPDKADRPALSRREGNQPGRRTLVSGEIHPLLLSP